jgi:ABC-type transport system involved in cytochrome bd biosynthesis fused ATPase/permease subunit
VNRTTILAILALPAGAIGFAITSAVLSSLGLPDALLLIVPLFVAGLCMAPFLVPLFDRMAKRDLAAHRAQEAAKAIDATKDQPPD